MDLKPIIIWLSLFSAAFGQLAIEGGNARYVVESPFRVRCDEAHAFYSWSANSFDVRIRGGLQSTVDVEARPGQHTIECHGITILVQDGQAVPQTTTYTIDIDVVGDVQEPDEPTPTPDKPSPSFKEFEAASRRAASQLNDEPTAKALHDTLKEFARAANPSTPTSTLAEDVRKRFERVMLARKGDSRSKDWFTVWRTPINDKIKPKDSAEFIGIISAIADGLVATPTGTKPLAITQAKVITMYTRADCVVCQQWKRNEQPAFERAGYRVAYVQATGSVPQFDVSDGSGKRRYSGYLTLSTVQAQK